MKKWMLIVLALLTISGVSQKTTLKPEKGKNLKYLGKSIPLREINPVISKDIPAEKPEFDHNASYSQPYDTGEYDRVVQNFILTNDTIPVIQNFEGVPCINVSNPDTEGDVGPDHYFQMVKRSFSIWDKQGALVYGPAENKTLWSDFPGPWHNYEWTDPIVIYDHLSDRWLASCMVYEIPVEYFEMVAVSATNDPLGAWHCYSMWFDVMPDYPKFGLWPDGYYLTINEFIITPSYQGIFDGASIIVFNREELMNGNPDPTIIYFHFEAPNQTTTEDIGSFLPSDLDGVPPPEGTPNYHICIKDDAWGYPHDRLWLWKCEIDWIDTSNCLFSEVAVLNTEIFNSNIYDMEYIHQPNTSQRLHSLGQFLMYRLQYRNFGDYQTLVCNHTVEVADNDHGAVRWYELRDEGNGWFINQQSSFAPDGESRWMGSIAMDADGNIGLGYSVSSDSVYPSIRLTGRRYFDDHGIMTFQETNVVEGNGHQTTNPRWGDYSTMSVDPVDDLTFWYTQEYMPSNGMLSWQTRIASFQLHKNLTHSTDSLVFITMDDCLNGLQITLKNNSMYDVEVNDIEPSGEFIGAQWYIDPYNFTFPFCINKGDSLVLTVFVEFITDSTIDGFLIDTLNLVTDYKSYGIPVYLNDQLLTEIDHNDMNPDKYLLNVYPNPSGGNMFISFKLIEDSRVKIDICDNNRRNILTLINANKLEKGDHMLEWKGIDQNGMSVSEGIYYIRLQVDKDEIIKKIIRN